MPTPRRSCGCPRSPGGPAESTSNRERTPGRTRTLGSCQDCIARSTAPRFHLIVTATDIHEELAFRQIPLGVRDGWPMSSPRMIAADSKSCAAAAGGAGRGGAPQRGTRGAAQMRICCVDETVREGEGAEVRRVPHHLPGEAAFRLLGEGRRCIVACPGYARDLGAHEEATRGTRMRCAGVRIRDTSERHR